jgi:hypothetical protein
MKEESRFSEQIESIQAGLISAVNPLFREVSASQQAIGDLIGQIFSFYAYIASLSILKVAHVPPPTEGETESDEKEPGFSPGAPSSDGLSPPINVAVAVHLSPITAILSEVERCITEMRENIPPVQADLAALVSMPASPVMDEGPATESGGFPLLPGSPDKPVELQKVSSETTLHHIRTTLLTGRPAELQKVSSERMLRDLPATLLTGMAGDEALTGPLYTPPVTAAPVHHHLYAGNKPEETEEIDKHPARPPLAVSPLLLLREIMSPAHPVTKSPSIPQFPQGFLDDFTRPTGSEAPKDFSNLWPKTSIPQFPQGSHHGFTRPTGSEAPTGFSHHWPKIPPQHMSRGIQRTDGKSPDALAPVQGAGGFTERKGVVRISPLHILSSLIAGSGDLTRTETRLPLTASPSLPVRLNTQHASKEGDHEVALSPFNLPALPLRILTGISPVATRRGESALKEPLSQIHSARFILSLLTGQDTGSSEGLESPPEPPLFTPAEAKQAVREISSAYEPVLTRAGPNRPQEGIKSEYPAQSQLQQIISVYSGTGTPMQAGSPFSGVLQPMTTTVNSIQPPAPPVKVTPPEIRKATEATVRSSPSSGERPVTFNNSFEINVQVRGGGIDGDMHELGRRIGSILADEMRRHGGI